MKPTFDIDEQTDELVLIRDRFKVAVDYWSKQHAQSKEDMLFCNPECQWPEEVRANRAGRPTYASDRLNAQVKSLVNAQRENRPGITVSPCGDGADEKTAKVIQGLFRHIEQRSKADLSYDSAFEDCVRCGLGFWRVQTQYETNETFDQEIVVEPIINPFQVFPDPFFKMPDGSDMEWCFIIETLTLDEFKQQYPHAAVSNWGSSEWEACQSDWISQGERTVIVAEYFYKTYDTKTLVRLKDGSIKDKNELLPHEESLIDIEREVQTPKIEWLKLNGSEIIERTDWLGSIIPVVPTFGDRLLDVNSGKTIYSGLVRKCMEEQMMLNVAKSTAVELIAAMPKTPWVGPTGFAASHRQDWQNINLKNLAYIEYDIMDDQGNTLPPPERNIADAPIQGTMAFMESIENDIKATNSMYDPNLGERVSNQSGVAIKSLQQQGSITNFHYSDNLSRAIRLTGDIVMDLIPKIYTEKKVVRIIGMDDVAELVTLNDPTMKDVYDLSKGRYEVAVTSGPSYLTRRQENLQILMDLAGKDPAIMQWAPDLIISQMDFPMKQSLVDRAKKTLPPNLQDAPKDDEEATPDQLKQQLSQYQQMVQQLTQTLQKETDLADKVTQDQQTKLQIAQLENQTQLAKHQASLQHDSNKLILETQLEKLRAESQQAHEVIRAIHDHIMAKDKETHKAIVETVATPPILPPNANNQGMQRMPCP